MGVYIKDMEMPKNCHECRLYEGDIYYCSAADKMIDISDSSAEKCQFCPLVPVPPHGRLIDADALCMKLKIMYAKAFGEGNTAYHAAYRSLERVVSHEPTIIEAEEGE